MDIPRMQNTVSDRIISRRMLWLDGLRLIAGVSIVGLHASSDINGQPFPDFEAAQRVVPVLFRSVIYIARTELFLLISLFLLCLSLDTRPRGYFLTIREQARRLLLPFVFWVVFYAFYRLIKAHAFGYEDAIWQELSSPWQWARYFFLGSVQYHMHFLPTLFGLVLLYPLYLVAIRNPWLGLIVLLSLLVKREVDVWAWANLQGMDGFPYFVRGVKILTYAGYGMVAGSFLGLVKRGMDRNRQREWLLLALICGGLLFSIKLVYSFKVIGSGNWQYNYTPAYWADFLMPVLLFLGCMVCAGRRWPAVLSRLAPYSFGLYLVHPAFLDLLEIGLWDKGLSPGAYVLAKFFGGVFLASLAVWALSKSRLLAWTVGLGPLPFSTLISRLRPGPHIPQ